jgi:hypothetical protein
VIRGFSLLPGRKEGSKKKEEHFMVHTWAFHWLHEISIPKRVRHRLDAQSTMNEHECPLNKGSP